VRGWPRPRTASQVLSRERGAGSTRSGDAQPAAAGIEPRMPPWVTLRWRGMVSARGGSAACAVHAPSSHATIAQRACAVGHVLRRIGETVGPVSPAPALSGHHRLSVRYLAADACHLPSMDGRDQPGTSSTLSPFQRGSHGTRPMGAGASGRHRRLSWGGRTDETHDVPSQACRRGPLPCLP
jgi:hypothetical protein